MAAEKEFRDTFNRISESIAGHEGAIEAGAYADSIQQAIDTAVEEIEHAANSDLGIHYAKGFVAEAWHSGTHNIDAAAKGVDARTTIDNSREFASSDISSNWGEKYGLKYYKNGIEAAKAQSKSFFERYCESKANHPGQTFSDFLKERGFSEDDVLKHDPIYQGQIRIVPKDQLEVAVDFLKDKIVKEAASRPELVHKLEDTLKSISDKIRSTEGSESIPLSEKESRVITDEIRRYEFDRNLHKLTSENFVKWEYILRESGEAALNAAVISAILKASPHIWECLQELLRDGSIDPDSLRTLGSAALKGSAEGAFRGGIAAAITVSCKTGLLGESLRSVNPTVVAAATVIAIRTFHNAIGLYQGKITGMDFTEALVRDSFVVTVGLTGASISQVLIPVPVLGALIGNFVGSIMAGFVFDGANKLFIAFCINSGFSFFNVVKQDYALPENVLREMGLDLIEPDYIELDEIELDTIEPDIIELDTIDITVLKRGLIRVRTIGYVPA